MVRVHGTCVELGGAGILLRGPSGSGKSDLALRLIDGGAVLVADDQVELRREGETVRASAPASLRGKMEVRGVGIVGMTARDGAALALVIDLAGPPVERLPEPASQDLLGVALPLLRLDPFEASAAAKVRVALGAGRGGA
jgi:HPr kinase/phosphorylase